MTAEERRLEESRRRLVHWKRWGPYLSERAWGTVREDYSASGDAWEYFSHDQARSRVYRWNEDGIAGICDRHQLVCFALALWNGRDPILKERLFGLTNREGNHGEDVKECYYYLDSTPTHSYMRFLYKYPQREFPYDLLVRENAARGRLDPEFELEDTGIFDDNRYFDVFVDYAKADSEDLLIRIRAANRGPETAILHLLPTVWFRNTWSWDNSGAPELRAAAGGIQLDAPRYGRRWLLCEGSPALLFTGNETNLSRLFGAVNSARYVKDAFHDYVVQGRADAVNPEARGSKAAAHYVFSVAPGGQAEVRLRLTDSTAAVDFDAVFEQRRREADEFSAAVIPAHLSDDGRSVMRQAIAGLLWSKQFYHYVVRDWRQGDPAQPPPQAGPRMARNAEWKNVYAADVLSMPDKWEYPWFAAWDLAFHCLPLALVD